LPRQISSANTNSPKIPQRSIMKPLGNCLSRGMVVVRMGHHLSVSGAPVGMCNHPSEAFKGRQIGAGGVGLLPTAPAMPMPAAPVVAAPPNLLAAASLIATPLAGIAVAAETPSSPNAADVTAAKAIFLSVICTLLVRQPNSHGIGCGNVTVAAVRGKANCGQVLSLDPVPLPTSVR
jgi:hypothetical protein